MLVRQLITMAMKWHLRSNLLKALSTPLVNIYSNNTIISHVFYNLHSSPTSNLSYMYIPTPTSN